MLKSLMILGGFMFATLPSTTNYQLNSYSFGSGGTGGSATSNYALEGSTGEVAGQTTATANYQTKPAFIETQQANVPKIASFDNGSGTYYNKLHFVIDQQSNPSDATYALSISTDNFASDIRYVKSDLTVGATLTTSDYLTYAAWGGASGSNVIGLLPNTTYYLKVKATQGKFTESGYGPIASASTVGPQLNFSISTNAIALGILSVGTVIDAPQTVDLVVNTNAASGADIFITSQNSGLYSTSSTNTIASATADLASASNGFGVQISSIGQTSGGPMSKISPYDGSGDNIGVTDTTIRKLSASSSPVTNGSASLQIKAKSSSTDDVANDYQEILTILASASF